MTCPIGSSGGGGGGSGGGGSVSVDGSAARLLLIGAVARLQRPAWQTTNGSHTQGQIPLMRLRLRCASVILLERIILAPCTTPIHVTQSCSHSTAVCMAIMCLALTGRDEDRVLQARTDASTVRLK